MFSRLKRLGGTSSHYRTSRSALDVDQLWRVVQFTGDTPLALGLKHGYKSRGMWYEELLIKQTLEEKYEQRSRS